MKALLVLSWFFFSSMALSETTKLDLRERIQFTRDAQKKVTFEYCKLNNCEKLNTQPLRHQALILAFQAGSLPTGIAKQILQNAGPNSEIRMQEYSVAGISIGNGELVRAVCKDQSIKVIMAKAKNEKDFIFDYPVSKCSGNGTSTSIKKEADILKASLDSLAH